VEILVNNILPGLIIAVATSWVTVRLSLRRFRTERWWERKADAYSDLLEKLVDAYGVAKRLQLRKQTPDPAFKTGAVEDVGELAKSLSGLRREVTRGAFLVHDDALANIETYLDTSTRQGEDFVDGAVQRIPQVISRI